MTQLEKPGLSIIRAMLRLMRYPGHYLLCYISYWLRCLSSLQVFAPSLSLSVHPATTCTVTWKTCGWRLNSYSMQSASLHNYLSVCWITLWLISHHNTMTVEGNKKRLGDRYSGADDLCSLPASDYTAFQFKILRLSYPCFITAQDNNEFVFEPLVLNVEAYRL